MSPSGKKFLTVIVSVVFTLLAAEILVRILTIYPNTLSSNRVPDENIGFRASQKIPEIDSSGFRNQEGTPKEIVAIGDSQTFGFNVPSSASWPSLLARVLNKPIYNFGSGGYGLLAYHGVLKNFLTPDTRAAIVALYPANDFEQYYASDADCLILNTPSTFWEQERTRLHLEWPAYPIGCLHEDDNSQGGVLDIVARHVALVALARDGIGALLGREAASAGLATPEGLSEDVLSFPDGLGSMKLARIEMHERSTDPSVPEVSAMMKDLPLLLMDWKATSDKGINIGVMVLPSRERVIYDYFDRKGRLGELDIRFVRGMAKQIAMEGFVRAQLEKSGVPFVFANEDLFRHLEYGMQKSIPLYPNADNGHPLALGYAAYASAARRLTVKMGLLPEAAN